MCKKWTIACVIPYLLLPLFVAPDTGFVLKYGPDNFKTQVEELDGNFVMFYAPWLDILI